MLPDRKNSKFQKEINAEYEYMNMGPPIIELATPLDIALTRVMRLRGLMKHQYLLLK